MKLTLKQLCALIDEAKIAAHPDYLKKEKLRQYLQDYVQDLVSSGEIDNQASLDDFWQTCDMAKRALTAIPFDVWSRMSGKKPAKKSA